MGLHPRLSIVVPVFKSRQQIASTVSEILKVMRGIGPTFELILVNDASPDGVWEILRALAQREPEIIAIDLVHHVGQHAALFCGISHAKGEFVLTMDDDGQNPPAEVPKLIAKIEEGYDVVFGRFMRKRHAWHRRLGSRVIGLLNQLVFDKPKHVTLSNFRIFRREVGDRMVRFRPAAPYLPGLLLMFAGSIGNVAVEHRPRMTGKSTYNLREISAVVGRILFFYSPVPRRLVAVLGATCILAGILGVAPTMMSSGISEAAAANSVSLLATMSLLGGTAILLLSWMAGMAQRRALLLLGQKGCYAVRAMEGGTPL